jgi:hypothetical protein
MFRVLMWLEIRDSRPWFHTRELYSQSADRGSDPEHPGGIRSKRFSAVYLLAGCMISYQLGTASVRKTRGGDYPDFIVVNPPRKMEREHAMVKVFFAISLMSLMACGSGESNIGATGDTPAVSATAPTGDAGELAEIEEMEAAEEVAALEGEQADLAADVAVIKSCLDLVASGDYEDAVPVCLQAADIDADDADVQAALEIAQAKTAEAATGAATDAATGAAADALGGLGN